MQFQSESIKMTAGSVAVPTIIPLRPPMPGLHKTSIDSNIKIELRTGKMSQIVHIEKKLNLR